MNILETIARYKIEEVAGRRQLYPVKTLEKSPLFSRQTVSMSRNLLMEGASGIIAEFKRQSPSKGIINGEAIAEEVTGGYIQAGASGLSVLTDTRFFGGSSADFLQVRARNEGPMLRKDFIIDAYQVIEAKSIGADVILLIASILTPEKVMELAGLAASLGMEVLLEVHHASELGHLNDRISMVGVNNRNLADFRVSLDNSINLAGLLPLGIPAISESGIRTPEDVNLLRQHGYRGFLIGELFMATGDPAGACRQFILASKKERSA